MSSSLGGDAGSSCGDTSSRSLPRWCRVDAASGDGGGCRSHPSPSIWEDVRYYRAQKASSTPATWVYYTITHGVCCLISSKKNIFLKARME